MYQGDLCSFERGHWFNRTFFEDRKTFKTPLTFPRNTYRIKTNRIPIFLPQECPFSGLAASMRCPNCYTCVSSPAYHFEDVLHKYGKQYVINWERAKDVMQSSKDPVIGRQLLDEVLDYRYGNSLHCFFVSHLLNRILTCPLSLDAILTSAQLQTRVQDVPCQTETTLAWICSSSSRAFMLYSYQSFLMSFQR